jgi:DNA-binding NarL/FixJ family response regulator
MKILIADDHALFRDGLAMRLEEIDPNVILLQAANFSQALKILDEEPDVNIIIADPDMPDLQREVGLKKLMLKAPHADVIVISASEDFKNIQKLLALGLKGYISKRSDVLVIKNAVKTIMEGGTYIPTALLDSLDETANNPYKPLHKTLTNRQSQVLDLIAQGKSNKQIAYEIGVSEATVKLHINALLRSLKVNNRTQAVVTAQKIGLI